MKILVVDDEIKLTELIKNRLEKDNYIIDVSFDGLDAYDKAIYNIYDLIILDVMLPYKDVFTLLKELKGKIKSQVIMLIVKIDLNDKLEGFSGGADDYLTKPFHLEELVARVNARLKKDNILENIYLEYEDIKLDLKKKAIICKTNLEEIEVLCKEFLYDYVWGFDNDSVSNNLEAYISFIRRKLKILNSKVNIKAVRGLGYKLEIIDE